MPDISGTLLNAMEAGVSTTGRNFSEADIVVGGHSNTRQMGQVQLVSAIEEGNGTSYYGSCTEMTKIFLKFFF